MKEESNWGYTACGLAGLIVGVGLTLFVITLHDIAVLADFFLRH